MWGWLQDLFDGKPRRKLGAISGRTRVHLEARVASPNSLTSPLTGTTAALLMVSVVERIIIETGGNIGGNREIEQFRTVGSTFLGTEVDLVDDEGTVVHVPAQGLVVRPLFTTGGNTITTVPPFLTPLVARASGSHVVCFRESAFREGDVVRLQAVVDLEATAPTQGYRSGMGQRAVARAEWGPVVLVERL
jgi:hypothetical protein